MALPETLRTGLEKRDIPISVIRRWGELVDQRAFYLPSALRVYDQVINPDKLNHNSLAELRQDPERVPFSQINHYLGREYTINLVAELIARVSTLISVGKQFEADGEMVLLTGQLISEDEQLRMMTISEFKYVLKQGASGAYGELYDRFDGNTVMTWCRKYWEVKLTTAERLNISQSENMKG